MDKFLERYWWVLAIIVIVYEYSSRKTKGVPKAPSGIAPTAPVVVTNSGITNNPIIKPYAPGPIKTPFRQSPYPQDQL